MMSTLSPALMRRGKSQPQLGKKNRWCLNPWPCRSYMNNIGRPAGQDYSRRRESARLDLAGWLAGWLTACVRHGDEE